VLHCKIIYIYILFIIEHKGGVSPEEKPMVLSWTDGHTHTLNAYSLD